MDMKRRSVNHTHRCEELMEIKTLTQEDLENAAVVIGCEPAVINTIVDVAGGRPGFMPDGEPYIWFHRDVFSRQTRGVYDSVAPEISNNGPGGFGLLGQQHDRLHKAIALDRDAALKSVGWGRFQIMGFNYALAGYGSLQDFVTAMYKNEGVQLAAFLQCLKSLSLDEDLRQGNWRSFAFKYKAANVRESYIARLYRTHAKYAGA